MISDSDWKWIMAVARADAAVHNRRARVFAMRIPERAARYVGRNWSYVIDYRIDRDR